MNVGGVRSIIPTDISAEFQMLVEPNAGRGLGQDRHESGAPLTTALLNSPKLLTSMRAACCGHWRLAGL
jgi:hypothetical protein